MRSSQIESTAAPAIRTAADLAGDTGDVRSLCPVPPEIRPLLPWPGIRRGATIAAVNSPSLVLTLLTDAIAAGNWAAIVGMPFLSPLAASQSYGIDLTRLALIPEPGDEWAAVLAALIDGLDMVVINAPHAPAEPVSRRLMQRARQRNRCVLITTQPWPGADLTLRLTDRRWYGIGLGSHRLRLQQATVEAIGRGAASRARQVTTWLPPTSVKDRVGPLPGDIPGQTMEQIMYPRRAVIDPDQAPAVPPTTLAAVRDPEPWWERHRVVDDEHPSKRRAG